MEPSPVDVLGGFHYFVVRLLEIVPEPGENRAQGARATRREILKTFSAGFSNYCKNTLRSLFT